MSIQVLCPTCQKELAAPDELAGRVAECPYCKNRFQVAAGTGNATPSAGSPKTNTGTVKMPTPATRSGAGSGIGSSVSMKGSAPPKPVSNGPAGSVPRNEPSLPPASPASESSPPGVPSIARSGNVQIKIPPPPPPVGNQSKAPNKPAPGTSPPVTAAPPPPAPSSAPAPPSQQPNPPVAKKRLNRAVFKTADTAKSQVHLGADGRLPELQLEEGITKERPAEERKQTHPMVLLAILGISVSMSVLLLLYEGETTRSEHRAKAEARQIIQERYLSKAPLEPYQVLLREAQQAHAQGNTSLERKRYRRVLDMLHAEDKNKNEGLTGLAEQSLNSRDAPNDRELENLLSKLLAQE